ncbi:MAG: hypothetical protein ACLFWR_05110, partial [Acidimicrobiales bacterium]
GRGFAHPVRIDLVSDAEFAAAVGADADGPTGDERIDIEATLDLARSLALVTDADDTDAVVADVATEVLVEHRTARYLVGEERIVVRDRGGDGFDLVTEVELVAALGMAWHDQRFGLSDASTFDGSRRAAGARGVAVGAGDVMAFRHVAELDADDAAEWDAHEDDTGGDGPVDLVATLATLPEALGGPLLELALADASADDDERELNWSTVDALLTGLPRTELELLDPWIGFEGFERVGVPTPSVPEGAEVLAEGNVGAATLYVLLALRVDALGALEAAVEWAGDTHVVTRGPDGRRCVALAVVGRDGIGSDLFEEQFEAWATAAPSDADASVERQNRVVTLRSCEVEPGVAPELVVEPGVAASVPVIRTRLLAELRFDDATRAEAECVADLALDGLALLTPDDDDDGVDEGGDRFEVLLRDSLRACRRR